MAWVLRNGKWVKADTPPPVPPRPGVKPPEMNALTAAFARNALKFMREHPLAPANGTTAGSTVTVEWALNQNDVVMDINRGSYEGAKNYNNVPHLQRMNVGVNIKHMVLYRNAEVTSSGNMVLAQPNSIIPMLYDQPDAKVGSIPVYWLPWSSLKICEQTIPAVPSDLVDIPEDEFPRFFLTAGINGCSIFARGDSTSPTIFHAGLADKLQGKTSAQFWTEQMAKAQTGYDPATIKGAVHKDEYMLTDPAEKKSYENLLNWMDNASSNRPIRIEIATGFGCVFGMRFGRHWSLYLQENAFVERYTILKRKDVVKTVTNNQGVINKSYASTGGAVVNRTVEQIPGRFRDKTVRNYTARESWAMPLKVMEFYPNRHWAGAFSCKVKATQV